VPDEQGLVLPQVAEWSDDELMRPSNREFADLVIDRARAYGRDVVDPEKWRVTPLDGEERRQALIVWNERHAWLEWWLGVPAPARELLALRDEDDMPIKVLLAQQIIDEVKHQRVFSQHARRLGGEARFERYRPPATLVKAYEATIQFDQPLEIAASLQSTGEAALMYVMEEPERTLLGRVLDDATAAAVADDVNPDEPRHIKIGHDLMVRYASTCEVRRRILEIQRNKLNALSRHYVEEFALLGAERRAPMPVV
jgi:hypothetical protein